MFPPREGAVWVAPHVERRATAVFISGFWRPGSVAVDVAVRPAPAPAPDVLVICEAPPPLRREVVVAAPSPYHVWIAGYWRHDGRDFVWTRSLGNGHPARASSGSPPAGRFAAAAGCSSKVAGIAAASSLSGFPPGQPPISSLKGSKPDWLLGSKIKFRCRAGSPDPAVPSEVEAGWRMSRLAALGTATPPYKFDVGPIVRKASPTALVRPQRGRLQQQALFPRFVSARRPEAPHRLPDAAAGESSLPKSSGERMQTDPGRCAPELAGKALLHAFPSLDHRVPELSFHPEKLPPVIPADLNAQFPSYPPDQRPGLALYKRTVGHVHAPDFL